MKKLALLAILASTLSACSVLEENDIGVDDLEKAAAFAECTNSCYEKVYGTSEVIVVE